MKSNKIQFAVVREDPEPIMHYILSQFDINNVLMLGSGGCNAITYKIFFENLNIDLIDFNPYQISLIKHKVEIQNSGITINDKTKMFDMLNNHGNFESLFRSFKNFINEFICDEKDLEKIFINNDRDKVKEIISNKYWNVAFDLFFSDELLVAMFTEDAIQHAPKNSYPTYFRKVLEKGLLNSDLNDNYFIQHIFLGKYLNQPLFMHFTNKVEFNYIEGEINSIEDLSKYDFIDLSNILDWMNEENIKKIAKKISKEVKTGTIVVYRQLNNKKNLNKFFTNFIYEKDISEQISKEDRALFYEKTNVLRKG